MENSGISTRMTAAKASARAHPDGEDTTNVAPTQADAPETRSEPERKRLRERDRDCLSRRPGNKSAGCISEKTAPTASLRGMNATTRAALLRCRTSVLGPEDNSQSGATGAGLPRFETVVDSAAIHFIATQRIRVLGGRSRGTWRRRRAGIPVAKPARRHRGSPAAAC